MHFSETANFAKVYLAHTCYDSDHWITENINIRVLFHLNRVAHILLNFVKKCSSKFDTILKVVETTLLFMMFDVISF